VKRHPYEDPEYWDMRADAEGVATRGWSPGLNSFYYSIKECVLTGKLASVPPSGSILEVGCGVGRIGRYIRSQRADASLIGVDFSARMLAAAAETGAYTALIRADIVELPFTNASFDLVLAMDVLFHVVRPANKGRAWCELARVARGDSSVFAYGSAHEITSLAVIDRLVSRLPIRLGGQNLRDRLVIWLTKRCDRG
jgi:SAM-dependent methyltransferase